MPSRIDTVEARAKLTPKRSPYWVKLERGISLGWRKLAAGSAGAWLVRIYDDALGRDRWQSLGTFEALPAHERYTAAKRAAEELAGHAARGGSIAELTVAQACAAYVEHLRAEGRSATADDVRARFRRHVLASKLAKVDLRKLSAHHLRTWRQGLKGAAVTANPHADEDKRRTRERAPSSINRDMTALRAALNHALEGGACASDAAWRGELRALKGATRRRAGYLDLAQRRALVAAAPADLALFLRGLSLLPLRPGALAALTVADFDRRLGTLRIDADKAGAGRIIALPEDTAAFLAECARDKLPAAPLFARADGKPWDRHTWKKPVVAAALAAGLPAGTTAYTLRHSTITDLVGAGLDVLTVARLSGTSLAMIDRHYGHLRAAHGAAALATLSL